MTANVGPYRLVATVSRGARAVVHRAVGPDGRDVAVKVLTTESDVALERFRREASLHADLGEGFVPLLDAGVHAGQPFLVTPWLPGGTLAARIQGRGLSVAEALALMLPVLRAMGRAHRRGVVHRDLKPENVLLDASGHPLVADLGVAKVDAPGPSLSRTGELRGTIGYMAPEQLQDAKSVTPATDVFALGAILWETLAGRPAFEAETLFDLLSRIARAEVEPLRRVRPDVPTWLHDAVHEALALEPRDRPRDGHELTRLLQRGAASAQRGRKRSLVSVSLALSVPALLALAIGSRWSGTSTRAAPDGVPPSGRTAPATERSPDAPASPPAGGSRVSPVASGCRVTARWQGPAADGLDHEVRAVAWPISTAAFTGDAQGVVRLRDPTRPDSPTRELTPRHRGAVWTLCGLRQPVAASGGAEGALRLWSADTGEVTFGVSSAHAGPIHSISGSGRWLLTADTTGRIAVWRIAAFNGAPGRVQAEHAYDAGSALGGRSAHVFDDGTAPLVFLGGDDGRVVEVRADRTTIDLGRQATAVTAMALLDTEIATGGDDGSISLWTSAPGLDPRSAHGLGGAVRALTSSSDRRRLAGVGADGTVAVWSVDERSPASLEPVASIRLDVGGDAPTSVVFDPDGDTLLVGTRQGGTLLVELDRGAASSR